VDARDKRGHDDPQVFIVTIIATSALTFVPVLVTLPKSRSVKDAGRVTAAGGARAVPAGGGSSPLLPGGPGISFPRYSLRWRMIDFNTEISDLLRTLMA
jgi:hypothetical protein